jgi:hypothetical protein
VARVGIDLEKPNRPLDHWMIRVSIMAIRVAYGEVMRIAVGTPDPWSIVDCEAGCHRVSFRAICSGRHGV